MAPIYSRLGSPVPKLLLVDSVGFKLYALFVFTKYLNSVLTCGDEMIE